MIMDDERTTIDVIEDIGNELKQLGAIYISCKPANEDLVDRDLDIALEYSSQTYGLFLLEVFIVQGDQLIFRFALGKELSEALQLGTAKGCPAVELHAGPTPSVPISDLLRPGANISNVVYFVALDNQSSEALHARSLDDLEGILTELSEKAVQLTLGLV